MKNSHPAHSRIEEMDALRGIALLGILLVNLFVFHAPLAYFSEFYGEFEGVQEMVVALVANFAGGKFLFIFAFLFGYGIVLQEHAHPNSFAPFFTKRMLMLLVFGVLHILLFWFGDILTSYAFLGLLLIPFRKLSNRNILILGSGFLLFRPLYYSGVEVFNWPMVNMERPFELNDFIGIYQDGNYVEIFKVRMSEFLSFMPENLVWYLPKTFGLFFIGMYAARKSFFALLRKNSPAYLTISIGLIFGSIAWNLYKADFFSRFDLEAAPHWRPVLIGINVFFETCLGIGYIIAFSLAFQKSKLLCKILARTGRLALTNYFIQSFVCVILFYGYGLGYYAKLVPSDLVLIAVLLFSFNVIFSYFYLAYKQIGPLEYVWRKGMSSKERSTNKGFTRES